MSIPTTTGQQLHLPRGVRVTTAREALRRAGWRLTLDARGRLQAEPLH